MRCPGSRGATASRAALVFLSHSVETKTERPSQSAPGPPGCQGDGEGQGEGPSPAGSLGSPRTLLGPEQWAGAGGGSQGRDAGEGAQGTEEAGALPQKSWTARRAESSARSTPSSRRWSLKGSRRAPLTPCAPRDRGSRLQNVLSLHWHCLEFPTANSFLHAKRFSPEM